MEIRGQWRNVNSNGVTNLVSRRRRINPSRKCRKSPSAVISLRLTWKKRKEEVRTLSVLGAKNSRGDDLLDARRRVGPLPTSRNQNYCQAARPSWKLLSVVLHLAGGEENRVNNSLY